MTFEEWNKDRRGYASYDELARAAFEAGHSSAIRSSLLQSSECAEPVKAGWIFNDRDDGLWNDAGGCEADSPEAAFLEGCAYGYEPGSSVYVGKVRPITWLDLVRQLDVVGRFHDFLVEACGEAGDDTFASLSQCDVSQLDTMIANAALVWAKAHKIYLPFALDNVHLGGVVPGENETAAYIGQHA